MTVQVTELARRPVIAHARKRGFLISVSGMDGSGKSSNTMALCQCLADRGFHVQRAWTGLKPIFSFPFLALVRLLGYTQRVKLRGLVFFRREIRRNHAISALWPIVVALDFVPRAIVSVVIPLHRGKIVVSDRYAYDVVAELIQEAHIGSRISTILLNLLPRPDIAFLMDVDEDLAWERAIVPGRAREQPYYDLRERRRIYLELARRNGIIVLNGSDEPLQNKRKILHRTLDAIGFTDLS